MGAVPTSSQTIPPAIFEISAANNIFFDEAYTNEATAITVSPAPLTSDIFRICVGINFFSVLLEKYTPCSDNVINHI
jgi:hypothetical protein